MLRQLLLLPFISVRSCPFAKVGSNLPINHPRIVGSATPNALVPDGTGGGAFFVPGGGISYPTHDGESLITVMDRLAKQHVADGKGSLCYWSWQSLPPPPGFGMTSSRLSYDFDAMEKAFPGDVAAIRDLSALANGRLQARIDIANKTSPIVFAAVTQGLEFGTYLCRKNLYKDQAEVPERCAENSPLYMQTMDLRWPMSTTVWKFDGTNADEVNSTIREWRSSPDGHLPNIMSPAPTPASFPQPATAHWPLSGTGWGKGGGLMSKLLPCDSIPGQFKYPQPFPQDSVGKNTSKTVLNVGVNFWQSTAGVPVPPTKCQVLGQSLCGNVKKNKLRCETCIFVAHMAALQKAGCTEAEGLAFCGL